MAHIRTYSSRVRIGNWTEDVVLEEETLKDFLGRRERGELTIQKISLLKQNMLKRVDLSASTDGCLHFGDTVMLVNPGTDGQHLHSQQLKTLRDPAAIGINANVNNLSASSSIGVPCDVCGTRTLEPSARTAFVIISVDGSPVGETVKYNQHFALRTTEGFAGGLFLESDIKTPQKFAKMSRHQEVSLIADPSFLTCWHVVYFDPQERLEFEGLPVPVNTKVLIAHSKTNQCLGILGSHVLRTSFGREYEVVAHTHLDSHKAECDVNHWQFVTANPGMESQSMLDRPAPMANITPTENPENQCTEPGDIRLDDEKQDDQFQEPYEA